MVSTLNPYEKEVKNKIIEDLSIYFYDNSNNNNKIDKLLCNYNYINDDRNNITCRFISRLWFQQFKTAVLLEIIEDRGKLLLMNDNNYKKEFYERNLNDAYEKTANELLKPIEISSLHFQEKEEELLALFNNYKNLSTKLNDYIMINNNVYKLLSIKFDSTIADINKVLMTFIDKNNEKIKFLESLLKYVITIFAIILAYNGCQNGF